MILSFGSPKCCESIMDLCNAMGMAFPNYYMFQCKKCGKILALGEKDLHRYYDKKEVRTSKQGSKKE